jgi:hypothetical protein
MEKTIDVDAAGYPYSRFTARGHEAERGAQLDSSSDDGIDRYKDNGRIVGLDWRIWHNGLGNLRSRARESQYAWLC